MDRKKIDNKGYSLVEFIIVIAIIAILAVASFLSLNYIRTAKAKEASVTFDTEVSVLKNRARNEACRFDSGDGNGVIEHPEANSCVLIYKDSDGRYYVKRGYTMASTDYYPSDMNPNGGKGVNLTTYIDVKYFDGSNTTDVSEAGQKVVYDASGRCIFGHGEFRFHKRSSTLMSTVFVNKNGSHSVN